MAVMSWEFESPPGHTYKTNMDKDDLAYIIGIAMGDGNLSNPNGRAVRLRVSCDSRYKNLIDNIISSIQKILPDNKVSKVIRGDNCIDISCYSNKLENLLGWSAKGGSKEKQKITVPIWIKNSKQISKSCLKGLFETDGSIYTDRNYLMANFVTILPTLASDVMEMVSNLGFKPNIQTRKEKNGKIKHTIRISKNVDKFIKDIKLWKA